MTAPVATTASGTSASAAPTTDTQQRQIQALRALAVGSVVVYHYWPRRLTGGYVGVDVFFVISGYLMTSTVLRLRERGHSFPALVREFYARRLRRILPAALVTLLVVSAVAFTLTPIDWQVNFKEIFAGSLFFENWVLAQQSTNYLAAARGASAVQHFWSLSVEEQFYLVWPGLVVLALGTSAVRRRRTLRLGGFLAVVVALSLAWSVYETWDDPTTAYFDTAARMWEFAVGAGALLLHRSGAVRVAVAAAAGWVGLVLIVASLLTYNADSSFPGWRAGVPVLGTALVLLCRRDSSRWGPYALLSVRPAQWVGDISYSIYLVHWPLLVLASDVVSGGATMPGRQRALLVPVMLLLAIALKRYVEDPCRHPHRLGARGPRSVWPLIAGATVVVATLSLAGWTSVAGRASTARADLAAFTAASSDCLGPQLDRPAADCRPAGQAGVEAGDRVVPDPLVATTDYPYARCQQSATSAEVSTCTFGSGRETVAVVGDSHTTQWLPAVLPWASARGIRVVTYLKSACTLTTTSLTPSCQEWNQGVQRALAGDPPDAVITSAESAKQQPTARQVSGIGEAWRQVQRAGITVIGLRDVPQPQAAGVENVPKCLMERSAASCDFDRTPATRHDLISRAAQQVPAARLVDMTSALCPTVRCAPVVEGALVYLDGSHMTGTFARSLTGALALALDEALDRSP